MTGVRVVFGAVLLCGATAAMGGVIGAAPTSTEPQATTTTTTTTTTTVAPNETLPEALLPNPTAEVRLGCGSSSSTRTVLAFVNNAPVDSQTALLLTTRLEDGSFLTDREVIVGDETPASPLLFWHVLGLQQGPWQVDSLIDECPVAGTGQGDGTSLPVTGADHWARFAVLAMGLIGAGIVLLRLPTWRGRPND